MRIRSFLALVITFCLTLGFVPEKTFAFSERGNAQFTDVVNTGKANDCPEIDSSLTGTISLSNGDSLKGICMHPTEVYVKVPAAKRQKAEFVSTKIISPRNNTTVTEVYGDIDSGKFTEKGGIDFQLITVLTPGGLEVPFAFSAKDLTASMPSSIEPGTELSGSTFTPNYRTGDFLDPKARAANTGVEYAQGLVALGGDDEELAKENIKVDVNGTGTIKLSITSVDSDTDEFSGTFEAVQPSDTDMGSKDPLDVKIKGILYGRKA
ncbi:MAG: Photosystem II manganese-stabilizing polypeptide [Prochlorococcus sp. SP3034]|nr:Photosystem II manganese-stabilizing polypeptide [Prochlorococcus sp. SP3034]